MRCPALRLQEGKKLKFQWVSRAERKFLDRFLADVVQPIPELKGQKVHASENLCRAYQNVVADHPDACPHCGAEFKPARKAALLSLLFPGLGDFYLGHRSFALLEMAGAAFFWLIFIVSPLIAGAWVDEATGEAYAMTGADWIFSAIPVAFMHIIDALMTRHFARKGHYLRDPFGDPLRAGCGGDLRAKNAPEPSVAKLHRASFS